MITGYDPGWTLGELLSRYSPDHPMRREYDDLVHAADRRDPAVFLTGLVFGLVFGAGIVVAL